MVENDFSINLKLNGFEKECERMKSIKGPEFLGDKGNKVLFTYQFFRLIISSNLTNTRAQAKVDGNKLGSETKHFPHTHREVIMTHGVLLFSPRGHIKGLLTSIGA